MASFKTLKELQGVFWQVLTGIVNNNAVQIRNSWQTEGAPDWKITDNVIFIQVLEESGDDITQNFDQLLEEYGDDFIQHDAFTRVVRLNVIGYGDSAYFYLTKIKFAIYRGIKALRQEKIYLIPEPDTIQSVPEQFQGRWWMRADLNLKFNTLVSFDTDVNAVKEVNANLYLNQSGASQRVDEDSVKVTDIE